MNNPLISVIIPCYNAEKTLAKCLDSVLHQTYPHLQILIINDGSKDKTPEIITEYQQKDQRIKAFHTENKGVSTARNLGLEHAQGEYICFVDSDDWVDADYCETLYQTLTENNADISIARFVLKYPHREERPYADQSIKIFNKDQALGHILEDDYIQSHPWAKLFKKELFHHISFPEDREAFEDYTTLYKVFQKANKVAVYNKPIYWYVQDSQSISHHLTPKRAYHFFLAAMEIHRFYQKNNIKKNNKIVKNTIKKALMIIKRIIRNNYKMEKEREVINQNMKAFLQYSPFQIGLEYYIYLRLFLYFPTIYTKIIK